MTRAAGPVALGALAVLALAGFLAYPTQPSYDAIWSLLWAREVLDGELPSFDAYRAPTQHPLVLAVSLVLAPLGDAAPRLLVALSLASFVALVAGVVRLGRASLGLLAGVVAALLIVTRLNFAFWAAFGFVDVPFLALVVWAAALEAERPRRGGVVWVLLVAAGLLRPEAWLFAAVYAAWVSLGAADARARMAAVACAAAGPAIWALTDLVVTGDPAFSFTYSTDHAAELGRDRGLADLPRATLSSASEVVKPPVLAVALAGLALVAWRGPRRAAALPAAVTLGGLATFLVVSLQGFSVIPRYFATAAVGLFLFAGFALTGWTARARGDRVRTAWAAGAAVLALAGVVFSALTLNPAKVDAELRLRERVFADLDALLADPAVRRARACGPVSVPNHKLLPYVRWRLDAGDGAVLARSDLRARGEAEAAGLSVVVRDPGLLRHPALGPLANDRDPRAIALPPPGFREVARRPSLAAWARC